VRSDVRKRTHQQRRGSSWAFPFSSRRRRRVGPSLAVHPTRIAPVHAVHLVPGVLQRAGGGNLQLAAGLRERLEMGRQSLYGAGVELQVVQVLVVLGLVLLRFGDVHASRLALAVGLALQTKLLAARVDHRAVVVAHVGREDDLGVVRGLEPLQLHVDVDPSALSDRSLAGGHAPAPHARPPKSPPPLPRPPRPPRPLISSHVSRSPPTPRAWNNARRESSIRGGIGERIQDAGGFEGRRNDSHRRTKRLSLAAFPSRGGVTFEARFYPSSYSGGCRGTAGRSRRDRKAVASFGARNRPAAKDSIRKMGRFV